MTRHNALLFFIFLALSFFHGCSTSELTYSDSKIAISIDKAVQNAQATTIHTQSHNFQTLFLKQHILRLDDGSLAVFEEGHTDVNFQLEHPTQKMLEVIFETKNIRRIYGKNFLNFYQITLQNGQTLNLLSQRSVDDHISLLYGMDTQTFNAFIKGVDANAPIAPHNASALQSPEDAIKTQWDVRKVHLFPLVVPLKSLQFF